MFSDFNWNTHLHSSMLSLEIKQAYVQSISQLKSTRCESFQKFERLGWTRFRRPTAVIGLHERSKVRRDSTRSLLARIRHSVAVKKVEFRQRSSMGSEQLAIILSMQPILSGNSLTLRLILPCSGVTFKTSLSCSKQTESRDSRIFLRFSSCLALIWAEVMFLQLTTTRLPSMLPCQSASRGTPITSVKQSNQSSQYCVLRRIWSMYIFLVSSNCIRCFSLFFCTAMASLSP